MNGERTTGTTGTTANPFLHDRHDREPGCGGGVSLTREMIISYKTVVKLVFDY